MRLAGCRLLRKSSKNRGVGSDRARVGGACPDCAHVSLLGGLKDRAVSLAVRQLLAPRLAPYGEMLSLQLDSQNKTLSLELLPKGEREPIRVTLAGYEIVEGDPPRLRVRAATASREWVEVLANQFLVGRTVDLPANLLPVLRLLL